MHTIYKLENTIRQYSWGSKTAFSALFNKTEPAQHPQAELWMGAHPIAPSRAIIKSKTVSLLELIQESPTEILGESAARRFANTLPFLLKILAAEKPLSIQAHPDSDHAIAGFLREEALGIPIESPERIYRDKNHKPELICALTPFWALNGFRSFADIHSSFDGIRTQLIKEQVNRFGKNQTESGLRDFYGYIMNLSGFGMNELIEKIVTKALSGEVSSDPRYKWITSIINDFPNDVGILDFLFLNIIELKSQEALYLPPARLHSYLSGIGIEVMANSDNVVRGGLTEKHVDKAELLSILSFDPSPPLVLHPSKKAHEETYETGAREFILSRISVIKHKYNPATSERNVEILIIVDGSGTITDESVQLPLSMQRGDSCIIPACVKNYRIEGKLTLFKATVPV